MIRVTAIVSTGFALGIGLASCAPQPEEALRDDHCANQNGDAWCAERHADGSRPFCARGSCGDTPEHDGCVEARPEDDACYSPCGGGLSLPEDASCLDGGTNGGTETGTTGSETGIDEGSTTGPIPCEGNDDCPDSAAPFCEPASGECVPCEGTDDPDMACASLDPSRPVCVESSCVQCTAEVSSACTGDTPVCDDATNTCVAATQCQTDSQCSGYDCNNGRCRVACTSNQHCDNATHRCDYSTNKCVAAAQCTTAAQCSGFACDNGRCRAGCLYDNDHCNAGFACTGGFKCVQGTACTNNGPCGVYDCDNGACRQACDGNNDCANGAACDLGSNTCKALTACTSDAQCSSSMAEAAASTSAGRSSPQAPATARQSFGRMRAPPGNTA